MRICCVISSLGSGGAERVMTELARSWQTRGDDVTLLTLDDGTSDFYEVPVGVQRVALGVTGNSHNTKSAITANVHRMRELRRAIRMAQPDVVVSFTDRTNVLVLLATKRLSVPVVISERIDPRHHQIGRAWNGLRRLTYRRASLLVVQTVSVAAWARELLPESRVHTIPNPIRVGDDAPPLPERQLQIAAIGRLAPQKGFDSLIDAFARTQREFPDWKLTIYGEGPERAKLEEKVERLALRHAVSLPGRVEKPDVVLARASIFALSSRYEGFPNALLEACVAGCACISTNCDSGPSDMIDDGRSGILVPVDDVSQLAHGLRKLMGDAALRDAMGSAARESVQRFHIDNVLAQWDDAFAVVMQRRNAA